MHNLGKPSIHNHKMQKTQSRKCKKCENAKPTKIHTLFKRRVKENKFILTIKFGIRHKLPSIMCITLQIKLM
jgi:hypothetical protein